MHYCNLRQSSIATRYIDFDQMTKCLNAQKIVRCKLRSILTPIVRLDRLTKIYR